MNLAYGVDHAGLVVARAAGRVLDLSRLDGLDVGPEVWTSGSLGAFFALGPDAWATTHAQVEDVAGDPPAQSVRALEDLRLQLPWDVADYVDFYASEEHATNMGRILRPDGDALPKAWKHLPIGYHGRAGTVIVSGEDVPRPNGLRGPGDYGPCRRLDVEVELGFVVGLGSRRGVPVAVDDAERHLFGVVLLNDWSARDVQAFEYVPLGPFLGKSFATSISPWVVPLAALEPYRVPGPSQDPQPVAYLRQGEPRNFDIRLELSLCGSPISCTSSDGLYWSIAQQVAHLTANGASLRAGDLLASGTISGSTPGSEGSLMELSVNGRRPIELAGGSTRTWLEDGDEVVIRAWCGDRALDLGEVRGRIIP